MKAIFQLRITLKHISPPIWRQVQVPMDFGLDQLHTLIQLVMGWDDYHLHEFELVGPGRGRWPERQLMPAEVIGHLFSDGAEDESKVSIGELCSKVGDKFVYTYDFGDYWIHEIKVQKILSAKPGEQYPLCLKGKRACPPEDCGGLPGYGNLLEVLSDPGHEEYEGLLEWVGGDFDPEAFDQETVAKELRNVKW